MLVKLVVLTFVVAAVSAKADLRLLGIQTRACPVAGCPAGSESTSSSSLEIRYGVKDTPQNYLTTFTTTYNDDGSVTFSVAPTSGSWPAGTRTHITVGSGGAGCEASVTGNSVSFPGVTFDKCGFQQSFGKESVHRRVVVRLCQRFPATSGNGVTVYYPGNRDITVDFHLAPVNPSNQIPIVPDIFPKSEKMGVCAVLTHKIVALKATKGSETWKFVVAADNYEPDLLNVGFSLEKCILRPYLKSNPAVPSSDPSHWLTIVENGAAHADFLPASSSPNYYNNVNQGKDYTLSVKRIISRNVPSSERMDPARAPQLECQVCLCDPLSNCPTSIPVITPAPGPRTRNIVQTYDALPPLENGKRQSLRAGPVNVVPARRKQMMQ